MSSIIRNMPLNVRSNIMTQHSTITVVIANVSIIGVSVRIVAGVRVSRIVFILDDTMIATIIIITSSIMSMIDLTNVIISSILMPTYCHYEYGCYFYDYYPYDYHSRDSGSPEDAARITEHARTCAHWDSFVGA